MNDTTVPDGPGETLALDRWQGQVVGLAARAPSTHNTQPWTWRIVDRGLELHADRSRQLRAIDPSGRDLVMSCGAALHHAVVAAQALGFHTDVTRLPEGPDSDLMARLTVRPGVRGAEEVAQLVALASRRTDRRRFTSWPVPEAKLAGLAEVARHWGCHAVPVVDASARWHLDTLVARARRIHLADPEVAREHRRWMDRGDVDGVPSSLVPGLDSLPEHRAPRFAGGTLPDPPVEAETEVSPGDGLIVLGGPADDVPAWLATGLGLSALWLQAERGGLSAVPLSQVTEVRSTQEDLERDVLGGLSVPHLVVRLGWPPISRRELPRSPRRPVADLLRP